MRKRSDPLVPILGSAVALVVLGSVGLVFYPRIKRWVGPDEASVAAVLRAPDAVVPVWVCRSVEGVAMLLEAHQPEGGLDEALTGGPYRYLVLTVYNFGRSEPYDLGIGTFVSPEGGPPAVPAAGKLHRDVAPHLAVVVRGLGAVDKLSVAPGRRGQALLVQPVGGKKTGGFACGELMFERKEMARLALAKWRERPTLKGFQDF